VKCSFTVRFDAREHESDMTRGTMPLLLSASGFALGLNGFPQPGRPATWLPAPDTRDCVFEVLAAVGV
jgi:hypothetical protein